MEDTQQTVVKSGSPFEVLALAEGTLGFEPRESLLLVSLRPPRWRTGLVARIDLPDPVSAVRVAQVLAQHVADDGAGRCFVAVVTDGGEIPRPRRPQRRSGRGGVRRSQLPRTVLAGQVARALTDLGIDPEPWLVHRGRLYSYDCQGPCCPPEGLPMERVRSTQVAAELVLDGRVLGRDRQQWDDALRAAVEPVGEEVLLAVEAALEEVGATMEEERCDTAPGAALATWRSLVAAPDFRDDATTDDDPTPPWPKTLEQRLDPLTCAVVLDGLTRIPLRDYLLGTLVSEALPPCREQDCSAGQDGGPTCMVCWFCGRDPRSAVLGRPDVEVAVRVLQLLAQRTRPGRRAVPLGCAAYLLWSTGAGPEAGHHAEMALADDPSHTLSDLVLRSVELGVAPPRVERRRRGGSPEGVSTS